MPEDDKKARSEREDTDTSLRKERTETDRALAESQSAVEAEADGVVRRARAAADAVVDKARDKADLRLGDDPDEAVTDDRALEDETLRDERASADEALRRQRRDDTRALSRLLPFEREATDRTLLTERLRADDDLLNRDHLLGVVSHDLRNLLAGIVLTATLLSERGPESDEGAPTLVLTDRIQRYAARMNRLIGDLLDVESIEAGKLAVTPVRDDLASLMGEALDLFQGTASAKGIALQMEVAERPLLAEVDHDRILQVLANLLANSIKFTARGGEIWIRGERAGDALSLSVSDTGAGIPRDMLEAVFERSRQVDMNDQRGLGLGLYISKHLIEAHGGRIWAESRLGEGTTVRFALPGA